jgi:RNA polymerase sigma-70 factor (ECF subfamily)
MKGHGPAQGIEATMTTPSTAIRSGFGILTTQPEAEAELVQRARNGDSEAFGRLYERSLDRVYRYIYFRVSDDDTAEDLTSKVFLKAWENLPRFKAGSSPFIAWLYTIAHNAVIDHYRTKRQTAPLDDILSLPASDPLPDEQYDSRSDAQALRESLKQLTGLQRDVVTMKLIDGMNTEEIAKRLHKSCGAIRALQMRGLQALAKILQDEIARD